MAKKFGYKKLESFLTQESEYKENETIKKVDDIDKFKNSPVDRLLGNDDGDLENYNINEYKQSERYLELENRKEELRLAKALAISKYDNSRLDEVDYNQPMDKRFAFAAPPELIDIVKDIAYHYRIEMRELYIEAISDLVKKYEAEKGVIRKRPGDVRITKHNSKL